MKRPRRRTRMRRIAVAVWCGLVLLLVALGVLVMADGMPMAPG